MLEPRAQRQKFVDRDGEIRAVGIMSLSVV
jgi:hypothetical protein